MELEAARAGLEVLDPIDRLAGTDLDALRAFSRDPLHPGAEGQAILADELTRWVEALPEG